MEHKRLSLEKQLTEAEENLHIIEERISEIADLKEIPLQWTKNKRKFETKIAELKEQLLKLTEQPVASTPATQPSPSEHEQHRESQLMNCEPHVKIYRDMLRREVSERVLLIKGEAKMGKSNLLRVFRRIGEQEKQANCALVDIRTSVKSIL